LLIYTSDAERTQRDKRQIRNQSYKPEFRPRDTAISFYWKFCSNACVMPNGTFGV